MAVAHILPHKQTNMGLTSSAQTAQTVADWSSVMVGTDFLKRQHGSTLL